MFIKAEFEMHILSDHQAYGNTYGKAKDYYSGIQSIGKEIPENHFKMGVYHTDDRSNAVPVLKTDDAHYAAHYKAKVGDLVF